MLLFFAVKLKQSPEKVSSTLKELPSEPVRNIKVWEVRTRFKKITDHLIKICDFFLLLNDPKHKLNLDNISHSKYVISTFKTESAAALLLYAFSL